MKWTVFSRTETATGVSNDVASTIYGACFDMRRPFKWNQHKNCIETGKWKLIETSEIDFIHREPDDVLGMQLKPPLVELASASR